MIDSDQCPIQIGVHSSNRHRQSHYLKSR